MPKPTDHTNCHRCTPHVPCSNHATNERHGAAGILAVIARDAQALDLARVGRTPADVKTAIDTNRGRRAATRKAA